MNTIIYGSQERYIINMSPHGESSLGNTNWSIKVKAAKEITIPKEEANRIDDNTYEFIVDTSKIGVGVIDIKAYIYLKDELVEGGERLIIRKFDLGDLIVR